VLERHRAAVELAQFARELGDLARGAFELGASGLEFLALGWLRKTVG
jgi:hypothetical protein